MKNDNQDKIIKEKFNQYIDNIEIPKNLEEVIMKNMKDIEKNEVQESEVQESEVQEKEVKGKTFNFKRFLGSAAAVVVIAGVATITSFEMGWIGEKQNNNVVAEKRSEAGKNTLLASNEQIKSLYDIQEYTDNLTDAANGKLAFLKLLENNELPLEEEDYYYVYKDDTYGMMIGNAYYIKEITNVTSEEGMMGNDDWAALFKVTVEYINDNDETKTFDLAIILLPNHEVQNKGIYANYTGTTAFVKGFTDLYQEGEISEERVKELAEFWLNMTTSGQSQRAVIKLLGFGDAKIDVTGEVSDWTIETDIKYSDYQEKLSEYLSQEFVNASNVKGESDNGYLIFKTQNHAGDTGGETEITNIEKIDSDTYKVDYNYTVRGTTDKTKFSIKITVKLENGKYVIDDVIRDINEENKISEERVKELAEFWLNMTTSGQSQRAVIKLLGFGDAKIDVTGEVSDWTIGTDIKYSDYQEKLSEYLSQEFVNTSNVKGESDNGYLIFKTQNHAGDAGGETEITNIEKIDSDTYKVDYNYTVRGTTDKTKFSMKITVKLENGKYVIEDVTRDNNVADEKNSDTEDKENNYSDAEKIDEIMYDIENVRGDIIDFSIGNSKSHMALYFEEYGKLNKDATVYKIGDYGNLDSIVFRYDKNNKIDMISIQDSQQPIGISTEGFTEFEEVEDYYKNNKHINVYKGNNTILVELDNENDDIVIKHDFENNSLKNITVYVNYALVTGEI